ncbi:hypothetical protein [Nocardia sp. NPDC052566]|uniref:hypothetical protein n=1 Tax=Nocardia sp. NPDC052566 TaxID=3364330 RepID=UPI0037C8158F
MSKVTDRMIAPNATDGEVTLGFSAAFAGAAAAFLLAWHADLDLWRIVVVTVVAFDLFGGAVVNATSAAKCWYHRPGRHWPHHLGFVAIHLHPFILALVVPGFGWAAAAIIYALILGGAVFVTFAPSLLQRPIAFCATAFSMVVVTSVQELPHAVAWFAPVLLLKLLLAHLLPEEATR